MPPGGRVRSWAVALGADLLQQESPATYAQYLQGSAVVAGTPQGQQCSRGIHDDVARLHTGHMAQPSMSALLRNSDRHDESSHDHRAREARGLASARFGVAA